MNYSDHMNGDDDQRALCDTASPEVPSSLINFLSPCTILIFFLLIHSSILCTDTSSKGLYPIDFYRKRWLQSFDFHYQFQLDISSTG